MKKGDYVIIKSMQKIGCISDVRLNSKLEFESYIIATSPQINAFSSVSISDPNDLIPLSEKNSVKAYPNNYMVARYGVCPRCKSTSMHYMADANRKRIDCDDCAPGMMDLFPTALERDIHLIEVRHGVVLQQIGNCDWSNK